MLFSMRLESGRCCKRLIICQLCFCSGAFSPEQKSMSLSFREVQKRCRRWANRLFLPNMVAKTSLRSSKDGLYPKRAGLRRASPTPAAQKPSSGRAKDFSPRRRCAPRGFGKGLRETESGKGFWKGLLERHVRLSERDVRTIFSGRTSVPAGEVGRKAGCCP